MKKIELLYIVALSSAYLLSCSNDTVVESSAIDDCHRTLVAEVDEFVFDDATRASIGGNLSFAWTKKDIIGVWPTVSADELDVVSQVQFKTSGTTPSASFTGSGWGLLPNRKYYGYFPYNASAIASSVSGTYVVASTQTSNDNTSHLSGNIYMYTSATAPEMGNVANFQFHHLGSIMKFDITVPESVSGSTFKQVMLTTEDPRFTNQFTFSPCTDTPVITALSKSDALTLSLGSGGKGFQPSGGKISVWFLTGSVDLTGVNIKVIVTDSSDNTYEGAVSGVVQDAGKAHLYEVNVE